MLQVCSVPFSIATEVEAFMRRHDARNPGMPEFHQAVFEVISSVMPLVMETAAYREQSVLARLTEPDRVVRFRVCWEDDRGQVHVNRGWRVQFNNAIGPYKGGLRFRADLTLSVLQFLGFEQIFKNSLTGLPMGGGKGGADFDPCGRSDREVMRFCQAFMTELHRHIGEDTDIPAGDIGVGAREISYLFGQYKRLSNRFVGTITGKGLGYGGSLLRKEATGFGAVYFLEDMLAERGEVLAGKTVAISGSGNVALHAARKCVELGARVVTLSDSSGAIHDPAGLDSGKLEFLEDLKEVRRGRLGEYAERFGCELFSGARPWRVACDVAIPCATQNELDGADAEALVGNGCVAVVEAANMPCTPEAVQRFQEAGILFAPGKAANAGGVAVSGLEQSQNAMRLSWSREDVDARLRGIMRGIHTGCAKHGRRADGSIDYVKGANVGGFIKVADAMVAHGLG